MTDELQGKLILFGIGLFFSALNNLPGALFIGLLFIATALEEGGGND
jgi:hypothetical protein